MVTYSKKKEKKLDFILQISFLFVAVIGYIITESMLGIISTLCIWFGILILITILRRRRLQKLLLSTGIGQIDFMNRKDFESYLMKFFKEEGYKVTHAPSTDHQGADILLKKEDESIAIFSQPSDKVADVQAIQHVVNALPHYESSQVWAITNYQYNAEATGLALQNNIIVLDREDLLERAISRDLASK